MPYSHSPVGISIRDHKLAALFFERILPFGPVYFADPTPDEVIIGQREAMPYVDVARFNEMVRPGGPLDLSELSAKIVPDSTDRAEVQAGYTEVRAIWHAQVYSTPEQAFVPLIFSRGAFAVINEGGQTNALQVLVNGLPFVDTSKAQWPQILEIRKDRQSISALRDLRLFFASNYEGKSADFVRDDVQRRLEDFERARKKFGFDLFISSAKVLLDSKSLLSVAGLTFAAAILGTPLTTTAAVLAGVSLEIGKLAINLTEQTHSFHSEAQSHELAYLIELKKKL